MVYRIAANLHAGNPGLLLHRINTQFVKTTAYNGKMTKEYNLKKQSMYFKEFKRLCFCNSAELLKHYYQIGDKIYEWIGIGVIEIDKTENLKKPIVKIEDNI
jgi:hypothetical protein